MAPKSPTKMRDVMRATKVTSSELNAVRDQLRRTLGPAAVLHERRLHVAGPGRSGLGDHDVLHDIVRSDVVVCDLFDIELQELTDGEAPVG